jgi:predicted Zn-dependent protease
LNYKATQSRTNILAPALLLIVIFTLVVSGCKSGAFGNHYSTSQEIALGQKEDADIEHSEKMDYDPALNTRVEHIAQPIFAQARLMRSNVVYKISIIDSPDVNAFSIPGGWVYVYTGLLDKVGNDNDALACIIGHETAHVVLRHVVKQMSDEEAKGTLVNILGVTTSNYNLFNAADALEEMDELHFSREDEYQADKYGLMFAYNAGYDPNGMIRFFQKLEVLQKGDQNPIYTEDHPLTRNRIDRAMALIHELRENNGHYPDDVDQTTAAAAKAADAVAVTTAPPAAATTGKQ